MCYRPNVRKVNPGIHALEHLVNHNFQHTKTHILGPLASIGGIRVLRGRFPPRNSCLWVPGGLASPISSTEVPPTYFLIGLGLFSPWTHGKPVLEPFVTLY